MKYFNKRGTSSPGIGTGLLSAGVILLHLAFSSVASAGATSGTLSQQLTEIVSRGIGKAFYPGAVLIVGRPGEELFSKPYGHYTYDADAKPMTMDTVFDQASVSKVVGTSTAAMKLLELHKLGLDDRVSSYIPEFASGGKDDDRIRDLLTHVSGLKSYTSAAAAEAQRKAEQSKSDAMIEHIATLPASYPPGTKVVYSCLNMQSQARVNEVAIGGRMDEFLKDNVYVPLGMKDTVYVLNEDQNSRCAPTQRNKDGSAIVAKTHDPIANYHDSDIHCPGNAGLFSTAPDLARYCDMILSDGKAGNKRVFKPETLRLMTSIQTPKEVRDERALGWDIYTTAPYCTRLNQTDETRCIGHTGYTGTMIWLDKLSKTYMVFLTNRTWPDDSTTSSRGTVATRKALIDVILHSRPEYKEVFASVSASASASE
ncbi:MAG: serine hydrolase domain-containing protein [Candidatus Sumerlaeaceae bacterium]